MGVLLNLWGDSLKHILKILNQSLPRPLSRVLTILFGGDRTEWRGSFLSWIPHNFVILKQDRKLPRRTPFIPYTKLSNPLNSDSVNYPVYYSQDRKLPRRTPFVCASDPDKNRTF
jgi:hypothetical protein